MKTTSFWSRLKAKYERKGGSIQTVRQIHSLSDQDAFNYLPSLAFIESAIDMIWIYQREVRVETPLGPMSYIEALGWTDTHVVPGDRIRRGVTKTEKIDNGGFETGDFTGWDTSGDDEEVSNHEAHSGTYSALIDFSNEYIEQQLDPPADITESVEELGVYEVVECVPSRVGTVVTHYVARMIRLHEPYNYSQVSFWYLADNSDFCNWAYCYFQVIITYTDDTTTTINYEIYRNAFTKGDWTFEDITDQLSVGKAVKAIKIYHYNGIENDVDSLYIDDVSILA